MISNISRMRNVAIMNQTKPGIDLRLKKERLINVTPNLYSGKVTDLNTTQQSTPLCFGF